MGKITQVITDMTGTLFHYDFSYTTLMQNLRENGPVFLDGAVPAEARRTVDAVRAESGLSGGREIMEYIFKKFDEGVVDPNHLDLSMWINKPGYESGKLITPVFEDVPRNVKKWLNLDVLTSTFSNCSVREQRLMLKHTQAGDLRGLMPVSFGPAEVGSKNEPKSYRAICKELGASPRKALFLSDSLSEIEPAREAGLEVAYVDRPGNKPMPKHNYRVIRSFDELRL